MEINDAVRLAILNIQKESITDVDVFSRPFEVDYLSNKDNQKKIYDIVEGRIKKALNAIKKGKDPSHIFSLNGCPHYLRSNEE